MNIRNHRSPNRGVAPKAARSSVPGPLRDEKGANLVEFAVIAPLLFLLLFGVVEIARVVHGFTTVWSAAREGARYATTVGDSDANGTPNYLDCDAIVSAAVAKVVGTDLGPDDITVRYFDHANSQVADCDDSSPSPAPPDANIDSGFTIEVEATATFNGVVPLLSNFLDGIDLSSTQTRSVFKGVLGGT